MAGIMHKTSRLMAAVLLGCLLVGCGGQLLSHREIVRAVFFTAQDAGYTVTLLTSKARIPPPAKPLPAAALPVLPPGMPPPKP